MTPDTLTPLEHRLRASLHPPQMGMSENLIGPFDCSCSACARTREELALITQLREARRKADAWDAVGAKIEGAAIGYNAPQIVSLVEHLRQAEAQLREARQANESVTSRWMSERNEAGRALRTAIQKAEQAEADNRALREELEKLPSPWKWRTSATFQDDIRVTSFACEWCRATANSETGTPTHPDNGCLALLTDRSPR